MVGDESIVTCLLREAEVEAEAEAGSEADADTQAGEGAEKSPGHSCLASGMDSDHDYCCSM